MKKMKKLLLVLWMMIGLVQGKTVFAANDDFTRPTDIQVNQVVTDKIEGWTDCNYYKFTLPVAGYINMSFSHAELESTSWMWRISLYSENRTQITGIYSRGSVKNVASNNIGLPAGTYYVKVNRDDEWSTIDYQLQVNYIQADNWETEFNDGFLQADSLTVNQLMNGSMLDSGSTDYDYYKFDVTTEGYIDVKFTHAKLESTSRMWNITLYDVNRNRLKAMSVTGNVESVNLGKIYLPVGSYYLLIDNYTDTKSTIDYTVKAYYTTPKATIKKSTPDYKKLTLQWKTLKGVSGYRIVTATDKNFKNNKKITQINSKKKSKTTIKKLKSKKKYYVKMRGYITVDGVTYYGPWSKVKTVTIK